MREGKEIYFLNAENKPVKVKDIEKQAYQGMIYDVECNITDSGGTNMWGIYFPPSYVLENTTFNITATIDMSSWQEGNYSTTCRSRDI